MVINNNSNYWTDNEGFNWPYPSKVSSRTRSWITIDEIDNEFPEFVDKLADIVFDDRYPNNMKDYARSILEFLDDWKWVSWKQFDAIIRITSFKKDGFKHYHKNGDLTIVKYGELVTIRKNIVSFTYRPEDPDYIFSNISNRSRVSDKQMDNLHKRIFGTRPIFEEEYNDGCEVNYREDGSRYFSMPSGNVQLIDYI